MKSVVLGRGSSLESEIKEVLKKLDSAIDTLHKLAREVREANDMWNSRHNMNFGTTTPKLVDILKRLFITAKNKNTGYDIDEDKFKTGVCALGQFPGGWNKELNSCEFENYVRNIQTKYPGISLFSKCTLDKGKTNKWASSSSLPLPIQTLVPNILPNGERT